MTGETPPSPSVFEDPLDTARDAIPSCSITEAELQGQRRRFGRLAPDARVTSRDVDQVSIEFAPGFDRSSLEAMVAVERRCCPFLTFDFDDETRRLRVGVRDAEHEPALDVLAQRLAR